MNFNRILPLTKTMRFVFDGTRCVYRRFTVPIRVLLASNQGINKVAAQLQSTKTQAKSCGNGGITGQTGSDSHTDSVGSRIFSRIARSLQDTRDTTEHAVLSIGNEISTLFDIAVNNNDSVKRSLRNVVGHSDNDDEEQSEPTIRELIESIRRSIDAFVEHAHSYFQQQSQNAEESWSRFENVAKSVVEIEEIADSSKVLAINAKIESARLGESGAAFAVVSNHLSSFSESIQHANSLIAESIRLMRDTMQQSREAAQEVEQELGEFSQRLVEEVASVEGHTQTLTESMHTTLSQVTASGIEMIDHSRNALSELQFQDPMVQGLKRTEHEVQKLIDLIETGACDDDELPDLDEAVGRDGRLERDAGEVELF